MKIHESTKQGSEAWDDWRSVRATASEFGKIFTGGGKVSAQKEAYMRKCAVARKYKLPDTFHGTEHTERGTELEPLARDLFVENYKIDLEEVACVEHENGLCGGSPDGIIRVDGVIVSGIEIKCLKYENHVQSYLSLMNGKLPTKYKPQVHGLLWLTAAPSWQFMVYHDDALPFEHKVLEVTPDQYTQDLGGEVLSFCEELERRHEEFIDDFEKSMNGVAMKEAMPVLFAQLETTDEEGLI